MANSMSNAPAFAGDDARARAAMARALRLAREGLDRLEASLNADGAALEALEAIAGLDGRLICTGLGKSGHVARKIAATLASTGTPAQYVHPAEASHGDLGMITPADGVLALSKSGETRELGDLIAYCRRFAVPLIAMTEGAESALARAADIILLMPKVEEACGETRAPTTSTTVMMAYGDALAVALIERRGFTAADFALFHPGGALGAALKTAAELMHAGAQAPLVAETASMAEALAVMSEKSLGCVGAVDGQGRLSGIVTDGDLRRHISGDLLEKPVSAVMTLSPQTAAPDLLAAEALRRMTAGARKITHLFIVDESGRPLGLLHIHDLLRAGVS